MSQALPLLSVVAAVGAGLVAGIFFAFSSFVMRALARLPGPPAIEAMQSINGTVIHPSFLGAFMGMAVVSLGSVALALSSWGAPWALPHLIGGLLYLLGTFLVTAAGNVPLNNRLERVSPTDPRAAGIWDEYLKRWTRWNHVRTIAAVGSSISFCVGLARLGGL